MTIDLDGTLLDTVPDLGAAANAMLHELGLPGRAEEEIRRFVGRGIPTLVQRCLPTDWMPDDAARERALEAFRRHYARVNGQQSRPYPGVIEGLDAMRRLGLPLAVITNKAAAFAEPLLAAQGLLDYFEFVVAGDSLAQKKPHPLPLQNACARLGSQPSDNLHIGDSAIDVACARAAGCPVIALPYGYNEGEDVRKLACDAIVASLVEAAALICALPPTQDAQGC